MTAFDPDDPRSVELHRRLHRSPSWRARFGLSALYRSELARGIAAQMRAVDAEAIEAYRSLVGSLDRFLPDGADPIALNAAAGLRWAISATFDADDGAVFTKARRDRTQKLADQVDVIEGFRRVCPDCIVVPRVLAFGESDGWTMLAVTDVGCEGPSTTPTLDQVLPLSVRISHGRSEPMALDAIMTLADPGALEALPKASELADRIVTDGSPSSVRVGLAHGDFVPWNMELDEHSRLRLWDWDHSMPLAPWPYDPIHFSMQERRHWHGEDSHSAWDSTAIALRRHAKELELSDDPRDIRGLMRLYALWRAANQYRLDPGNPDADWLLELALSR